MTDPRAVADLTDGALEQLKADPGLRAVVQAARAWGVSPRRFLRPGEPARVLVHEHDEHGRLVRTVETNPEWDPEAVALAVALARWEADLCGGCGQPLAETTTPEAEERFVPTVAVRCHHCTATAMGAKAAETDYYPEALLIPVRDRWKEAQVMEDA